MKALAICVMVGAVIGCLGSLTLAILTTSGWTGWGVPNLAHKLTFWVYAVVFSLWAWLGNFMVKNSA